MNDVGKIPPNLRVLRIMEVISASETSMTPTEINATLRLPKQTVHRLCNTLLEEGWLIRESNSKKLRPSRRLRSMASGLLYSSQVHIARHQILMEVANAARETVNFVVPQDRGMSYLDRVETDWPFRIQLPIGTHVPFHCTASGKTYLASLPPAARKKMVASLELEKLTPNTFDQADALLDELKTIARRGYALDREEFVEGMVAIAVPVRDMDGRYFASVAIHGPSQRISIDRAISEKPMLVDAAARLSQAIFA